jgi:hypothetical protein
MPSTQLPFTGVEQIPYAMPLAWAGRRIKTKTCDYGNAQGRLELRAK